jgi:hypothetical protein
MPISHLYPNSNPSIRLNFAKAKKLDPRITFSRNSTGTVLNSQGYVETVGIDAPRFDHSYDRVSNSVVSLGLLIEDAKVNLFTFSDQFSNAAWTKTNTTIGANSLISPPTGIGSVLSIIDNTTNAAHTISRSVSSTLTNTYSFSCFARSGINSTGYAIQLTSTISGLSQKLVFDLDNGVAISSYTSGIYTSFIQPYPNGWYRVGYAATATSTTASSFTIGIALKSGAGITTNYVGSGGSICVWGAQLETSPIPSSYIQSDASSGIRSGDIAYMDLGQSSWFNSTQGSLVFEHRPVGFSTTTLAGYPAIGFANTAGSSTYAFQYFFDRSANKTSQYLARNNGLDISTINYFATTYSEFPAAKVGFAYTSNLFTLARNGSVVGTGAGTTVPSVATLLIGNNAKVDSQTINSTISYIHYYPQALTSTQLQNLTKRA